MSSTTKKKPAPKTAPKGVKPKTPPAPKTERVRKAAIAEIAARLEEPKLDHEVPSPKEIANDANLASFAGTQVPPKRGKPRGAPKQVGAEASSGPKRVSALDAAAQVLALSDKPLRVGDLIADMEAKGLWKSPGGKTPAATLYSAITREITTKGKEARFRKLERGLFAAAPRQ